MVSLGTLRASRVGMTGRQRRSALRGPKGLAALKKKQKQKKNLKNKKKIIEGKERVAGMKEKKLLKTRNADSR